MYLEKISSECKKLGTTLSDAWIYVSISEQKLYFYRNGALALKYTISTSKNPPSCIENSYGTPTGLHCINNKIGNSEANGMIFKGRKPTGKTYQQLDKSELTDNLITSRILWLKGLERGVNEGANRDSHKRYIYIHGSNQEDKIGTAVSHGCILLSNKDVIELYEACTEGSMVLISE